MICFRLLSLWAFIGIYSLAAADGPKKPQWQRMLTGEDAKRAEDLKSRINRLAALGDQAELTKVAEELLELRVQKQGLGHYEVTDARFLLADIRKSWTPLQLEKLNQAFQLGKKAFELHLADRFADASPLWKESLDNFREVRGEDHPNTAAAYNGVASNLSELGKYGEAYNYYQRALEIRKKVLGEQHPDTARSYNNMAVNLYNRGKYFEALPLFKYALDVRRSLHGENHNDTAQAYSNLGSNLNELTLYSRAQEFHLKALEILKSTVGEEDEKTADCYDNLACSLNAQGKYKEALPLHRKALAIMLKTHGEEHTKTATSYSNLAVNLNQLGAYHEAQLNHERALQIRKRILGEQHPRTAQSYNNLALSLVAQRKYSEARRVLERAIPCYEASRLAAVFGLDRASLDIFNPRLIQAVLQHPKTPADAWRSVELSLARGLLDHQSGGPLLTLTPAEQEEQTKQLERIAAIQARILYLATMVERTKNETAELESLSEERREKATQLAELLASASQRQVADTSTIARALPEDSAILYWADVASTSGDVQEHWACVVIPNGKPIWERLDGTGKKGKWTADDSALPFKLRRALANSAPYTEVGKLTMKLRDQRIAPLLPNLYGVKTLYVIPVGLMTGVPVGLLVPERTVSYVPSGTFLARAKARVPAEGEQLLALGNPVFTWPDEASVPAKHEEADAVVASLRGGNWSELPGTRLEVARLQKLFGDRCKPLNEEMASEQQLETMRRSGELAKFKYLHFATHGEGNQLEAFESSLILSQDSPRLNAEPKAGEPLINGRLSAREVLDFWELDAELVTLSACETASGSDSVGDGALGFAQAFLDAGARSVCLSLWKVDDFATALLMERFYANLLGKRQGLHGPMGKAAALDEAKRWLRGLTRTQVRDLRRQLQTKGASGDTNTAIEALGLTRVIMRENTVNPRPGPYAHPKYWAAFILIGDPN